MVGMVCDHAAKCMQNAASNVNIVLFFIFVAYILAKITNKVD